MGPTWISYQQSLYICGPSSFELEQVYNTTIRMLGLVRFRLTHPSHRALAAVPAENPNQRQQRRTMTLRVRLKIIGNLETVHD